MQEKFGVGANMHLVGLTTGADVLADGEDVVDEVVAEAPTEKVAEVEDISALDGGEASVEACSGGCWPGEVGKKGAKSRSTSSIER